MAGSQPLYMEILKYLRDKIHNRQLLPGQKLPTELELAEQFGVSRITSKKAMQELEREGLIYRKRGKGSFVSPVPDKTINTGLGKVISIIFPYDKVEGWVMEYINGAISYLTPNGYYLSIHCTEGKDDAERSFFGGFQRSGIGGIIYYPDSTTENVDILGSICLNNYPVVTIDKYFEGIPLSAVVTDNFNGEYMLTEYLIKLGHRRIAYMANEEIGEKTSLRDRYLGYCKALKDNEIDINFEIVSTGYIKEIKHPELEINRIEYLKGKIAYLINNGVTAIVTQNDMEAVLLVKVLNEMKVNIPKCMSIAGFDDIDLLGQLGIHLTTVRQNLFEVGRKAAEIIVKMNKEKYEYVKEIVPCELVIRETTAGPAGNDRTYDQPI